MKVRSFIIVITILTIIALSLLLLYTYGIVGSGTGGIMGLYELDCSVESTETTLDSLVKSNDSLEEISGDEYFELLQYKGEFESDLRYDYVQFKYIIFFENKEKIIFKYNFIDSSLALVSATNFGNFFNLASKINYWDTYRYKNIFDREIISKLNKEM